MYAGNTIIEQSALNTRLYYVFSGELEAIFIPKRMHREYACLVRGSGLL